MVQITGINVPMKYSYWMAVPTEKDNKKTEDCLHFRQTGQKWTLSLYQENLGNKIYYGPIKVF